MSDIESWGDPVDMGLASAAALELCESAKNLDPMAVNAYKNQFISDAVDGLRNGSEIVANHAKVSDPIIANHIERTGHGIPSESVRVEIPHTDVQFINESMNVDEPDKKSKRNKQFATPKGPIDMESANVYLNESNVNIRAFANSLCEVLGVPRHLLNVPERANFKSLVEDAMWIKPNPICCVPEKYMLDYMAERIISIFGMNRERGMKLYADAKSFRGFVSEIISTSDEDEKLRKTRWENECKMSAWGFDPENPENPETPIEELSDVPSKMEAEAMIRSGRVLGANPFLGCAESSSNRESTKSTPTTTTAPPSGQKEEVVGLRQHPVKETNDTRLTNAIAALKSAVLPDAPVKKVTISITYEM